MVVDVSFLDAFVFGASILKPDFDLGFGETQGDGQFGPPTPTHVLGLLELDLQPQRLFLRERRPLTPLAQSFAFPPRHCWQTRHNHSI